jgi:hypothetical protein
VLSGRERRREAGGAMSDHNQLLRIPRHSGITAWTSNDQRTPIDIDD